MPAEFQISDDDIAFAESALLPTGANFDEERRRFIKCLDTADLQAVPGSGKTTALLAKLLVLERHLSFPDCQGVLVISHTNAAVNEIRGRIGGICPKLFAYPNFVGTIQSFVDTFLAIPFFVNTFGFRPSHIDNDSYRFRADQFQRVFLAGYSQVEQNRAKYFLASNKCGSSFRLSLENGQVVPVENISAGHLKIQKPRPNSKNYINWDENEKERVASWLIDYKKRIMRDGILCYDDAYFLAKLALDRWNMIPGLLQNRFGFVFVDEMQDMAPHQYRVIEDVFSGETQANTVLQRIGDSDQAIFGGKNIVDIAGWNPRRETMSLSNSLRLAPPIAKILAPFAYERDEAFELTGLQASEILPHLLLFDDDSVGLVVERYAELIARFRLDGSIPANAPMRFMAVAWNSVWNEDPNPAERKRRLIDFCPSFQRPVLGKQEEFETLADYLYGIDTDDKTLRSARNSILRAACRVLRLGEVVDPRSDRPFTPTSLVSYSRFEGPEKNYNRINRALLKWSLNLVAGKIEVTLHALQKVLPKLVNYFGGTPAIAAGFLTGEQTIMSEDRPDKDKNSNSLTFGDIQIGLGTVHSVKGQTHTATLYIESAYYNDGGKMYESQRLAGQFKGERLRSNAGKRVKESAKMIYVGFSRPTHLLVFAVHKENFDSHLSDIDATRWEVVHA